MKMLDDLPFSREDAMIDEILHRKLLDVPKEKSACNATREDDEEQFG